MFSAFIAILLSVLAPLSAPAASTDLPNCQYEDSNNCVWYADMQGNGQGNSFYVINGEVTYF